MLTLPPAETSLWREEYLQNHYPELEDDTQVDVAIVGGGITGLTAAYLLKRSGLTVAVLDKRTIGAGTTGRTTGKITSQHNLIYTKMIKQLGLATARAYAEANQSAVQLVASIIKKEKLNCDWRREANYVYTTDSGLVAEFAQEARNAVTLGLPASFEKTVPLPFDIQAAVKFSDQATFHPQAYLNALANTIVGSGSHIFENSRVTRIHDGHQPFITAGGRRLHARQILVATNVPTLPLAARGGYCLFEYPTKSYIIAGPLKKKLVGMYISPDSGEYSLLGVKNGNKYLLLVGGEGHLPVVPGNNRFYQRLADYAEQRFGMASITHRWSDRDYQAYDGIPLVGKLYPWSQHVYVATGFQKWGLTNGTAAAMILHDQIMGVDNPWAFAFRTNRFKPVASIPRVAASYLGVKH
jgi:glycine/D-amino acid oxidase-like deaminating enzyme